MILMTILFVAIGTYEFHYMYKRGRKKRTYWIVALSMLAAYLLDMSVYTIRDLPGFNQAISFFFKF
ncbi:hypothetical protein [Paenibacillus whitsoniae]|uniref:Uncharacterized protein n=1 Tax=Paenibacillus whitsoniae TaxID=2496558 RepID=A0A430JD86_9BACL|nr:hypothetical protein [Paenibacillus whitsoniae]RTE09032.1 hypothetical protein EJQ19_14300 [Paenibacillus whitsoniae]